MATPKDKQPPTKTQKPATSSTPAPKTRKLSLDVTDVSEVLERKISP